jgi:hypothetical protein
MGSLETAISNLEKYDPSSHGGLGKMHIAESSSGPDMSRRDHLAKAVEVLRSLYIECTYVQTLMRYIYFRLKWQFP